jgi:hypothetical protein
VSASVRASGRAAGPGPGMPSGASRAVPGAVSGGRPARPLAVTGGIAACAAAGTGLAVLTTLTAIGWAAAPHAGLGNGLGGVLRTAAVLWLAAHHVAFRLRGAGSVGMLPLGLVLLPGALLWGAGRWVVRSGQVERLRHVGYAAVALAVPYALLCGALAMASKAPRAAPSLTQAVVAGFLIALAAGGLGAARALAPWGRLAGLLPGRPRSVIMGTLGCLAVLTLTGAALAGGSLGAHLGQFRAVTGALSPGPVGAVLLLFAELAYLPNAVIWAIAYALGPGFAFGAGTIVAPTGSALGALPAFPLLAALPAGPRAAVPGWLAVTVLAAPYLAGVFGGVVTMRIMPTPLPEAAPLWGFASGAAAGCVTGALAAFAGGPLGSGRLAAVGPSGWQVSLAAVLELGVTGALAAGAANWLLLRRGAGAGWLPHAGEGRAGARTGRAGAPGRAGQPAVVDETDDQGGHRIYVNPWAGEETEPG